jgi:drug/metabolite transporter (DMT)-like permease
MKTRHFAQLVAMSALWGASFPFIRVASPALGPWGVAGIRCLLAAIVLGLLMRWLGQRWPARSAWASLTRLAIFTLVIPFLLFNWASLSLPAGYSAVLNATMPLFGAIFAAMLGEEKLTLRRVIGCAIGFAGVALLVQLGPVETSARVVLAAVACTVAAASYGLGSVMMKRATRDHEPLTASATVHVAAAALLAIPTMATVQSMQFSIPAAVSMLVLGTITSGFMYWISMRLLREIPPSAANSAAFMIPFFGVTWGNLFLGEPVTPGMLPGCALVLIATALITGFNPFRGAPPEP